MKLPKNIYIFDFDDTLYWAPDWHAKAEINDKYILVDPGDSPQLKKAKRFVEGKGLFLKIDKKHQTNGRSIYFYVVNSAGVPIDKINGLSKTKLKQHGLAINKKYSPFIAVTDDPIYYLDPATLGIGGENKEMMDLYRDHHKNAFILTARRNISGMKEGILQLLKSHPPIDAILRESGNASKYKGDFILSILKDFGVEKVNYYDDNLEYIRGVEKVVEEFDLKNTSKLRDKLLITHVSDIGRPLSPLKTVFALLSILGRDNYLRKSGYIHREIRKVYGK